MRELTYAKTLNETLKQLLYRNDDVILIGQGVTSPWYVGSTTEGIVDEFGHERIIDTPISESCVTGAAIGASSGAIVGGFNKYDESKERQHYQQQYNEQQSREYSAKKGNYDRAYKACLQGRGYTVN